MINDDGYNYPDASFPPYEYPTYADGITPNLNKVKSDEIADDLSQCLDSKMDNKNNQIENQNQAYQKSSSVDHKGSTLEEENLNIALINVLEMAKEYCANNFINEADLIEADKIIAEESINKVQEFLGQMKNNFKSPEESNL
jgi:hypothetical protein